MLSLWILEKEEDDGDGDGANGKVDVEAPAPRDTLSNDAGQLISWQ